MKKSAFPETYFCRNRIPAEVIGKYDMYYIEYNLKGRVNGYRYSSRACTDYEIPVYDRIKYGIYNSEDIASLISDMDDVKKLMEFYGMSAKELSEVTTVPERNIHRWSTDSDSKRKCPDYVLNMMKIVAAYKVR